MRVRVLILTYLVIHEGHVRVKDKSSNYKEKSESLTLHVTYFMFGKMEVELTIKTEVRMAGSLAEDNASKAIF